MAEPFKLGIPSLDTNTYANLPGFTWPEKQNPETYDRQTPKVNNKIQIPYSDRWIIYSYGTAPMQLAIQGTVWQLQDMKSFYAQAAKSVLDSTGQNTINFSQRFYKPNGNIEFIAITSGGSGYTTAPNVVFDNTGTGGTGAAATSTISGGVVVGITITNAGSGYSIVRPTISFSGGGGSGAAAICSRHIFYKIINGSVKENRFALNPLGFPYIANFDCIDPFAYSDYEVQMPDITGWVGAAPLDNKATNYNNGNAYVYPRFEIKNNSGSAITQITIQDKDTTNTLTWNGSLANAATLRIYQDYLAQTSGPDFGATVLGIVSGRVNGKYITVQPNAKANLKFDTPAQPGTNITAWVHIRDRNW